MNLLLLPAVLILGPQSPGTPSDALLALLEDECHAEAFYQAVIDRHGEVRPFINIVEAERRHQAALLQHLEQMRIPVPANPWVKRPITVPSTLEGCLEQAAEAEVQNVALYDRWLKVIQDPALRETFAQLRWASQERHLPAFRRHLQR